MTRLLLCAAVATAAVSACSGSPSSPTLPVQKLCGHVVSVEVGLAERDATGPTTLRLTADQPNLIVFDHTCHGVTVDPSPRSVFRIPNPSWDKVGEVHGPSGLVGGIYIRAQTGTVRLRVTPRDRSAYVVTLLFHRAG